ncbi:homogentisate 1,2-dioxygenase [Actinocorallia sp. B10E7]|uniref:homogentisate 1,2-dioxygenase n=1 Tax=Actinocorallia sp. B10E7 TaxID=3153558 RepID=UPI00325E1CCF
MAYYRRIGEVPDKRHTQHRGPDGTLYREELVGEEGFSADSSLLYHRGNPSALSDARPWDPPAEGYRRNHPLLPRHLRPYALFPEGGEGTDAVTGRRVLLGNADVRISYVVADTPSPLYKDAVGDQCVYVEEGEAVVETVFGALNVWSGDYVILPRGTIHRWLPSGRVRLYCIEGAGHIGPPSRYLSRQGQFLEHAPYCERDLRAPAEPLLREGRDVEVHLRHRGGGTVHVHSTHPFDVVGWDGCLYPYAFSIHDFEPVTGRVHQPPPVHQVFAGRNFVVCNFVPRKVDYHPLAVPVPYSHSNVDSDEVMFYCGGDYEARRGSGIERGSISLHPGGHTHGPHPGVPERSLGLESVDELAVMVDTFAPLELGEGGSACEDSDYAWTWDVRR